MNSNIEQQLREAFNDGFKSVQRKGLLEGAIAISKVIFDKATAKNKSPEEKLSDIIRFCEVSLQNRTESGDSIS